MTLERNDISDPAFETEIFENLQEFGYTPERNDDLIRLTGVGVGSGDGSVNLSLNLIEIEGHRILELSTQLKSPGVTFDKAVIVSVQGNLSCLTAKFTPFENLGQGTHGVRAGMTIYADHLSKQELNAMLYLFIKEVDAIDNVLEDMLQN